MLHDIQAQSTQSLQIIQECQSSLKKLEQHYCNALQEIRDDKKLVALSKLYAEMQTLLTQGELQITQMQVIAKQAARDAKTSNDNAKHCEAIMDALSAKFSDIEIKRPKPPLTQDNTESSTQASEQVKEDSSHNDKQ